MINFFRKIRQKLLTENRFSKYLIYAIGEIVLVVIGILIALNINNWNEQNKLINLESKILQELHSNLNVDLAEIREDISLMDDVNKACDDIKIHLGTHNIPTDSFYIMSSILRVSPHFSPNKSGYGLLESRGIELIRNDSLRNKISYLYEMLYPYYKTYEDERSRFLALHNETKLLEYFLMDFNKERSMSYRGFYFEITEEDYRKLKKDDKFLKLVSAVAFENKVILNRARRVEQGILSLIKNIENELAN